MKKKNRKIEIKSIKTIKKRRENKRKNSVKIKSQYSFIHSLRQTDRLADRRAYKPADKRKKF